MDYKYYLEKLEGILADPLPETPSESLAPFSEAWANASLEMQTKIDGIELPGWDFFNDASKGFRKNEFTILCGPTGVGKTTLLANLACTLSAGGTPIFVGSVETGKNDFMRVMAGILTGKNPYDLWSDSELAEAEKDFGSILKSERNMFCRYDSRVSHKRLLADLLFAHDALGTKVALVDNLNFIMDITRSADQIVEMDKTVHDFVVFVKKIPMHVVMVMHPKKTDSGRVGSEFDIKGSSTAVQEASNVILWNRLESQKDAPMGMLAPEWCRELKFCKVRKNGRAVGTRIIYSIDNASPKMKEERIL